jgi:hypothetical protein
MQSHELVETLHKRQTQEQLDKDLNEAEELMVGSLLDSCPDIINKLIYGKFCKNEFGHIEFSTKSYPTEGPHSKPASMAGTIDIIYPAFVGIDGKREGLGQIGRKMSWSHENDSRGWVDAWITLGGERSHDIDTEPLTPKDPRWEAVFIPFQIAVQECLEQI